MKNMIDEYIDLHVEQNVSYAEPANKKFRLPKIGQLMETNNLKGFSLKFAELHNTILFIVFGGKLQENIKRNKIYQLKKYYQNFVNVKTIYSPCITENLPQIYLDVTFSMAQTSVTGISRVVAQICKHGVYQQVIPVFIHESNVYYFNNSSSKYLTVNFKSDDILILPDAAWNYMEDLFVIFDKISINNAKVVTILYDLIPLDYPKLSNAHHVAAYVSWLKLIVSNSDYILSISKAVADDLLRYLECAAIESKCPKSIGWAHLGSDFCTSTTTPSICSDNDRILIPEPYFLSVGTVEPRKAYSVGLDAMEILWAMGVDAAYVIVGKYGWSQALLRDRILNHPEYDKRLFWFGSASDRELEKLYRNAKALVSTSLCEGFGLPIIEAAQYGLASIVSDIPVFREIGGASTQFFQVTNSEELATRLLSTINKAKIIPDLEFLTWQDAINNMLTIIRSDDYQYKNSRKGGIYY